MPEVSAFRYGIRFNHLYNALPASQRSRAGSWTQKIVAMGFRLSSTYCAHKDNITRQIERTAPHPGKTFYVCARETIRKFPNLTDQISPVLNAMHTADGEETTVSDEPDSAGNDRPDATNPNQAQDSDDDTIILQINFLDNELFVGADGQRMDIRAYGERTREGIRFDLGDMLAAFQANIVNNSQPASIESVRSKIRVHGGDVVERDLVDMWNFVRAVNHYGRFGNENAALVFDWMVSVVYSAQFGDRSAPSQADHAAGVGHTLPAEFGKDVCGCYAYAFLEGSESVLQELPSLRTFVDTLGIGDEPWSLCKSGHSEHMRGRLQAQDTKEMLAIHADTRITHGHFWSVPNKNLAAKTETSIRQNTLAEFSVTLDEYPRMTELFILPTGRQDWLNEEGKRIAAGMLSSALDKSEVSVLKLECKHRDAIDKLRQEKDDAVAKKDETIANKDEVIAKLREEKLKIAHTAARMLCPKKKLSTLDSMFQTS